MGSLGFGVYGPEYLTSRISHRSREDLLFIICFYATWTPICIWRGTWYSEFWWHSSLPEMHTKTQRHISKTMKNLIGNMNCKKIQIQILFFFYSILFLLLLSHCLHSVRLGLSLFVKRQFRRISPSLPVSTFRVPIRLMERANDFWKLLKLLANSWEISFGSVP